ncbi:hypothetical protein I317_07380 [Kwoniella heveanensis CBS 569]|nr:hypothetical protein I317_07380 [Kwoniella heveanensis CBS 569]
MYIPYHSTILPSLEVSQPGKRAISSFPGSSGNGLRAPLKILIPVFAVFFTIVILGVIAPKLRQCYVHDQLRSAERRNTQHRSRPSLNAQQPFEIDGPTVTPFPAPSQNLPAHYPWTPRVDRAPQREPSPTRPGDYPWTPRVPERAHTSSSSRQMASSPVVQVIPPAYSFISSPQAEAERDVPASTTGGQLGGLERPASDIPRIHSPVGISSVGSISGVDAPPQYESIVTPAR